MTDSLSQYCPNCEAQTKTIEALREALAEQVEACFCLDCEMCFRHEQLLKETGQ